MDKAEILARISETINVGFDEAELIYDKAALGGEFNVEDEGEVWLNEKFLENSVLIDEEGYTKMCVDALKILSRTAGTDYGSSRQRDMAQMWADMTRGYLGEYAFTRFLKQNWNIEAKLDHQAGRLRDFLPMDIHELLLPDGSRRPPKIKISIKTTKWNGLWLDIPGDQFNHSDVHVLVKVGAGRDHLFAFFKKLSVFKDKILQRGMDVGSLSREESSALFDCLPSFRPIPAYICGFVKKDPRYDSPLSYKGRKGRTNFTITSWNGKISSGDLDQIKQRETAKNVKFESIGDFAHDSGYLFNTGNLLWGERDWGEIVSAL